MRMSERRRGMPIWAKFLITIAAAVLPITILIVIKII